MFRSFVFIIFLLFLLEFLGRAHRTRAEGCKTCAKEIGATRVVRPSARARWR
jgi:hypothetical protein